MSNFEHLQREAFIRSKLEPDVEGGISSPIEFSQAISLKRIADIMEEFLISYRQLT